MARTIFVDHEPGTYKVYLTIGGYVVNFLDEKNNIRPTDGDTIYKYRQGAYRRCKQLNDNLKERLMDKKRGWTHEEIALDDISASDLQQEIKQTSGEIRAYRIHLQDEAEVAQALYLNGRLGIAWGSDATWADVKDVESGIEMWVNNGEEWERRN